MDHIAKSKLLKTVNIDLDAMIKESDKEYRITDNSQPNNTFDESVTLTMSENIPEPPSEMPSEYMNIRMSVPSAQGITQDSYDISNDISQCNKREAQKTSFARTNKGPLDLYRDNKGFNTDKDMK